MHHPILTLTRARTVAELRGVYRMTLDAVPGGMDSCVRLCWPWNEPLFITWAQDRVVEVGAVDGEPMGWIIAEPIGGGRLAVHVCWLPGKNRFALALPLWKKFSEKYGDYRLAASIPLDRRDVIRLARFAGIEHTET